MLPAGPGADVHDSVLSRCTVLDGTGEPLHSIPDPYQHCGTWARWPLADQRFDVRAIFASEGGHCTGAPLDKILKNTILTMKVKSPRIGEQVLDPGYRKRCQPGPEGRHPAWRFASQRGIGLAERFGCKDRYER